MRTAVGTRSNSSSRHSSARQRAPVRRTDIEPSAGKLLAFTIDAHTAQIVKLESLDASGSRHELSDEEKTRLVRQGGEGRLEDVLEQAFAAGIDCVLGGGEAESSQESEEDAQLRHLLLAPLIEHSPAKRLLQREVLNRAMLETLIQHSMKSEGALAPRGPGSGLEPERAESARTN